MQSLGIILLIENVRLLRLIPKMWKNPIEKEKMSKVTLHTIFEDKETLVDFARIFNLSIDDFENEEGQNYLNEHFPLNKINQARSLFQLRKIKGCLFMNFWDVPLQPLDKLYLNDLNLDAMGFTEMDLRNADFSNSSLVRAYFRAANLENANFQHANLTNAYLMGANLKGVNFNAAVLENILL